MNKVLLYINDFLESLDIPTITKVESKKINTRIKKKSKNIHLEN